MRHGLPSASGMLFSLVLAASTVHLDCAEGPQG